MRKPVSKKKSTPKLPKTVMILGRKYKVIEKPSITVKNEEASGGCDTVNREIEIEKGLPLNEKMGILAHEMAHGAIVINGLSETLTDREIEMVCQICRSIVEDFVTAFNK